ncbi:hypothetical protein [Trichocoleus sp. ST-U1]
MSLAHCDRSEARSQFWCGDAIAFLRCGFHRSTPGSKRSLNTNFWFG